MPAVSRVRVPCIAQLASELGYASKPTLLRHLERIDELGPQIDSSIVYPEDWIVFRITGYRPDITDPAMIPGESLLGDLSAVAEQISEFAKLTEEDLRESYETIQSLTERWSVSRKTIERYRRHGLVARRLDKGKGRRAVVFMTSCVEWFESLHHDRLGKAARFDRIPTASIQLFERWAAGYQRRLGWSRAQSARRIAQRSGHSQEGVRLALIRIDQQRENPLFTEPGPSTPAKQRFALRAISRGIEPKRIAERQGRSRSAVLRSIHSARMSRLRSWNLPAPFNTDQPIADDDSVFEPIPVRTDLVSTGQSDLRHLIDSLRESRPVVAYEERTRMVAYHALLVRSGAALHASSRPTISRAELDQIETNLRWAMKLKVELVVSQSALILATIEHQIGGTIDQLSPSRAAFLLLGSFQIASGAIDRFDPTHTGRLAAPVGLGLTRFVSQQPDIAQPIEQGKAARRVPLGFTIPDWTMSVTPWHQALRCAWLPRDPAALKEVLAQLDERDRVLLTRRFALDGAPPMTLIEVADLLGTVPLHAIRYERSALRNLSAVVRGMY